MPSEAFLERVPVCPLEVVGDRRFCVAQYPPTPNEHHSGHLLAVTALSQWEGNIFPTGELRAGV